MSANARTRAKQRRAEIFCESIAQRMEWNALAKARGQSFSSFVVFAVSRALETEAADADDHEDVRALYTRLHTAQARVRELEALLSTAARAGDLQRSHATRSGIPVYSLDPALLDLVLAAARAPRTTLTRREIDAWADARGEGAAGTVADQLALLETHGVLERVAAGWRVHVGV